MHLFFQQMPPNKQLSTEHYATVRAYRDEKDTAFVYKELLIKKNKPNTYSVSVVELKNLFSGAGMLAFNS